MRMLLLLLVSSHAARINRIHAKVTFRYVRACVVHRANDDTSTGHRCRWTYVVDEANWPNNMPHRAHRHSYEQQRRASRRQLPLEQIRNFGHSPWAASKITAHPSKLRLNSSPHHSQSSAHRVTRATAKWDNDVRQATVITRLSRTWNVRKCVQIYICTYASANIDYINIQHVSSIVVTVVVRSVCERTRRPSMRATLPINTQKVP